MFFFSILSFIYLFIYFLISRTSVDFSNFGNLYIVKTQHFDSDDILWCHIISYEMEIKQTCVNYEFWKHLLNGFNWKKCY